MCEGWSLEIGTAFRGAVVIQDRVDQPQTRFASVNAAYLGEYLDRDLTMARVEANIEEIMQTVLNDWGAVSGGEGEAS